ncbi:hypothetical protein LTR15_005631 [Elasticomyces elasticus]|nr:hypothetical protein LTR15_005631 [Elasticomyces elasticus]
MSPTARLDSPTEYHSGPPPSYVEGVAAANAFGEQAIVSDNGRIAIDLNSRLSRTLSRVTHLPPAYTEVEHTQLDVGLHERYDGTFPIHLNIVIQVLRAGCIGGDPEELMAYMVKNPGLIPSMKSLETGDVARKWEMVSTILQGCWESCIEADPESDDPFVADAIIANPPGFVHIHCAEALGIPIHVVFTMPWTATRDFPHSLANITSSHTYPKFVNCLSYAVVEWMTWQGLGDVKNEWRQKLDLETIPRTEGPMLAQTLEIPHTCCWSSALIAVYKRGRRSASSPQLSRVSSQQSMRSEHKADANSPSRGSSLRTMTNSTMSCTRSPNDGESVERSQNVASSMALAFGKSYRKFFSSYTNGMLVEMPLAVAEGYRRLPGAWGDEAKDYGTVTDWNSGGVVAGRSFVQGIGDGFRDVLMQPIKGGRE